MKYVVRSVLAGALGGIVLGQRLKADVNHCIADERLFVLPNGVPDTGLHWSAETRQQSGPVKILFLSNLVDYKGPMEFLQMAKIVSKKKSDVLFIMAGRPSSARYYDSLRKWIAENELEDCIIFTGGVHGKQKEDLFQSAHIFVVPTLKDTFSLVNVEAMQWSLPVITSSVGSIPDVVQDGISGYIIDPKNTEQFAEKVMLLMSEPELRLKMGAAGRRIFESRYSLDAYIKNVDKALNYFLSISSKNSVI